MAIYKLLFENIIEEIKKASALNEIKNLRNHHQVNRKIITAYASQITELVFKSRNLNHICKNTSQKRNLSFSLQFFIKSFYFIIFTALL